MESVERGDGAAAVLTVDVTARKAHQYAVAALTALGLLLAGWAGAALVGVAGAVMLLGRFWWPADLFRQFVWRVAEPRGWLTRRDVPEDRQTRRIARALGGIALLLSAAALAADGRLIALLIGVPVGGMIVLDASTDLCLLCLVRYQARLARYRLAHR